MIKFVLIDFGSKGVFMNEISAITLYLPEEIRLDGDFLDHLCFHSQFQVFQQAAQGLARKRDASCCRLSVYRNGCPGSIGPGGG